MLPSILSRKIFDRITTIRRGEIIESPHIKKKKTVRKK